MSHATPHPTPRAARAALTLRVWAAYIAAFGVILFVAPRALLEPCGLPCREEPWARLVGALALFIAYYYVRLAATGVPALMRWTVHTRLALLPCCLVLVLAGVAPPILLAFGALDLIGAAWTWCYLR